MADTPFLKILPWNGYSAALSLTFDDGDPSQLDVALPEMEKRGLRGTFYLIPGKLARTGDWKKFAASGQEIGNHSMNHKHARDLAPGEELSQITDAKKILEDLFKEPVHSFAYPFTEITPGLRQTSEIHHLLARGGPGETYYLGADQDPDWAYLPSQVALRHTSFGVYQGWAEEALIRKSWTIPQLHAFEGTLSGWQPLSRGTLVHFLDYLTDLKKDLWIAPLGEVGSYWRAQKIVENSSTTTKGPLTTWTWKKSPLFPGGIQLKAKPSRSNAQLSQNGRPIVSGTASVYPIDFDAENLTLEIR